MARFSLGYYSNELGDDLSVRGSSNSHVGVSFLAPLLVSHPNRRTALYLYDCHGGGGYSGVIVRNHSEFRGAERLARVLGVDGGSGGRRKHRN